MGLSLQQWEFVNSLTYRAFVPLSKQVDTDLNGKRQGLPLIASYVEANPKGQYSLRIGQGLKPRST